MFGITFFGVLIYWFSIAGWIAWALAVVLESLFTGLFGALWGATSRWVRGGAVVFAGAALWVACEYVRARVPFGGFTWGDLAQSQHNLPWMLRSAAIAGGWGTAFLMVSSATCLVCALSAVRAEHRRTAIIYVVAAIALIALPLLAPRSTATGSELRVAIVQGNVPRSFIGRTIAKEREIIRSHVRLTKQLAPRHPDLVVWPESAVGIDLRRFPEVARVVEGAARSVHAPLIVGTNFDVDPTHYKVVALLLSSRGTILDVYQKTHLVPFGEYVPGRRFLSWIPLLAQIPEDALPAEHATLFTVDGGKVAPVLSFEGDFGSLVRDRIHAGGGLLVVATNTSTWGTTPASAQHLAMSQVRAAENGVWVVHAAVSGISAFIAPDGTVVRSTPLWKATSMVQKVRFGDGTTFYTRTGDWLPILCLMAALAMAVAGIARSGKRPLGSVT